MSLKTISRLSSRNRVSIYYSVQAMSVGVVNAFAGIWFVSKGIGPEEIGFITAAPLTAILLVGVLVGRMADQAPDWRQIIVYGALASGLVPIVLIFANGFWGILIVWTLAVTTQMAILPVVDAASIRLARRLEFDFSQLYAWKTVGYMATIFIAGFIIAEFGVSAFLPLFIMLSLLRAVVAFGLPKFRGALQAPKASLEAHNLIDLLKPWFLFPLLGWGLVHSTHFVLNGFLGLLWHAQGISESTIGLLIVFGSIAEIAMFLGFQRYFSRFPTRALILASCVVATLRWAALAFSPTVPILFGLQQLQAATYALGFLACTNFIADRANEDIAAQAQSFFGILQSGVAIFALISFGWLAANFGALAFLASAGLAALGALLVVVSMTIKK
jgi:MFS transporter, PPP family, 3-phenylpropionic acid transporter